MHTRSGGSGGRTAFGEVAQTSRLLYRRHSCRPDILKLWTPAKRRVTWSEVDLRPVEGGRPEGTTLFVLAGQNRCVAARPNGLERSRRAISFGPPGRPRDWFQGFPSVSKMSLAITLLSSKERIVRIVTEETEFAR